MKPNKNETRLYDAILDDHEYLMKLRHDLHAHPELAFEEKRTASIVEKILTEAGLKVTSNVGGTGVVASLSNGNSNRVIGLRADLDALAMHEANDLPYKSTVPGKFHGCGHDGHTVMLLGAARYLVKYPRFDGTVHFIFQPAEEGEGGANAMIEDGLFERFPMQQVFGMHNDPAQEVGEFAIRKGAFLAGYQPFDIIISGKGGHAAFPQDCIDPVIIAAQIIQNLQTIVSRTLKPTTGAVLTVTQCKTGEAYNIISDQVLLGGSIRYFEDTDGAIIKNRMQKIVQDVATANGASAKIQFQSTFYHPLFNSDVETQLAIDAASQLIGSDNINKECPLLMASDDFSHMSREIPGSYILIGNGSKDGVGICMPHNPDYDFNDRVIPLGASYWVKLVETTLAKLDN